MKKFVTSLLDVAGAAGVAAGAFRWDMGLGLVVTGGFLLAISRRVVRG